MDEGTQEKGAWLMNSLGGTSQNESTRIRRYPRGRALVTLGILVLTPPTAFFWRACRQLVA
jgi:hypothetical protein